MRRYLKKFFWESNDDSHSIAGGKGSPTTTDINSILGSVGAKLDEDKIDFLLSEFKGKDIVKVIAVGKEKLASMLTGDAGGCLLLHLKEKKVEEEKKEPEEDSDEDMGISLFD
ncbi:hypothetical protein KP509_19G031000 [Ceratopteris richardii]|uniref:Uncharacterized protein n=1 Tax=Ceratopteris richardii TaxID=49495 RepID=A0A8T2SM78_CERRI|nr:hypothetical protein KP509_19G031000 [Ceratopteris richardii]